MHGLAKKLTLPLISLVLFLMVAEGFFRFVPRHRDQFGMPVDDVLIPDAKLIWRLKPYENGPFTTNEPPPTLRRVSTAQH